MLHDFRQLKKIYVVAAICSILTVFSKAGVVLELPSHIEASRIFQSSPGIVRALGTNGVLVTFFGEALVLTNDLANSPTFNPALLSPVSDVHPQGGFFTHGDSTHCVWRLDASGTRLDFPSPPLPPNTFLTVIASQPDGKVIVGGDTTGTPAIFYIRLNADGSIDSSFAPNTYMPTTLAVLSDGKILHLGGGDLSRLLPNGQTDPTFTFVNSTIAALALQSDGRIVITGGFTSIHGIPRFHLARLNSNGTLDFSFNPPPNWGFGGPTIAVQSDNRIVVPTGNFLYRFFSDGRKDDTFSRRTTGRAIFAVAVDPSDRIYVGDDSGLLQQFSGRVRVRTSPSEAPLVLERSSAIETGWSAVQTIPANTSGDYIDANYPGTGNTFYRARPAP